MLDKNKIVFEAKQICLIVRKLFSNQNEHLDNNKNYFGSEANTFDSTKIYFEAKGLKFQNEAKQINIKLWI
jgi:hypothetical protein